MAEHIETRKLAAVMFTDIEGYTSMFHQNETLAMDKIALHRQNIEGVTGRHHGQVIQFYGDGSLVIFDSVIDAVHSAIDIQKVSQRQDLPVRIGIHLGDLVFKEGNIFGDVVNLASRIQSEGIPGSIIVSRKIIDELSNHPEITVTPLGVFELKNIPDPQELFAITGQGLTVPQAKRVNKPNNSKSLMMAIVMIIMAAGIWMLYSSLSNKKIRTALRDEKIAVPPFENFTNDETYNAVSLMASHWITTELIELADANVVSYPSSSFYTNTSQASMPLQQQFAKKTGAVNIIKGAFSFTGDQKDSLIFWISIINSGTGDPLPLEFGKSYCKADDPLSCIRELSNEIKGFWKSKNDMVLSPPNYSAYKAYLQARSTWDGENDTIPENYLREAIRLDPNFLDAYFLLLDLFYNRRNPQEAMDTLRSMRVRFTNLTPRQENYLMYHEEDLKGRRVDAFRHFMKEYDIDPKDIFVNTSGMVMALNYLNDPDLVIRFHEEIDHTGLDLSLCPYCLERIMLAMQSYMEKGDLENARPLAEKLKTHAMKRNDFQRLIEWYFFTNDTAAVNHLLAKVATLELDLDYRYLTFVAARQAALKGNTSLKNYYADRAIALYSDKPSRALARAYYIRDDLENAYKTYQLILNENRDDIRIHGELGLIYAKRKDEMAAGEIIRQLEAMKGPFDYGETPYMQGRIIAVMGKHEEALRYLNQSLDEGQLFLNTVSFQGDPDLMVLNDHQGYQLLLQRNRQK